MPGIKLAGDVFRRLDVRTWPKPKVGFPGNNLTELYEGLESAQGLK
jgi:hypothetical protein